MTKNKIIIGLFTLAVIISTGLFYSKWKARKRAEFASQFPSQHARNSVPLASYPFGIKGPEKVEKKDEKKEADPFEAYIDEFEIGIPRLEELKKEQVRILSVSDPHLENLLKNPKDELDMKMTMVPFQRVIVDLVLKRLEVMDLYGFESAVGHLAQEERGSESKREKNKREKQEAITKSKEKNSKGLIRYLNDEVADLKKIGFSKDFIKALDKKMSYHD
jgi:hypothetical protein